jgi:hypothetical protein
MPICTTASQTVAVNDGDMVNFDSDAVSGFAWDHYDGLGIGQAQNFNANITQDSAIGAFFTATQAQAANVTASINLSSNGPTTTRTTASSVAITSVAMPNNATTTTTSVLNAPATSTTIPVPNNSTVTTSQGVNQTVYVTQTVADTTITNIVTTTVANVTVTQANSTTTVTMTIVVTTGP